ncbi:hypothetical protein BRETT_001304 [Brettanomyces bruxellensis]|uniref:Uncharacterized protein n=1 Tax=Dekkera bruxellensis TaxID=5007 RepID=A0A871R6S2_DEKBR|nr:uncharacterized protein BRETT_001304 [Brettanomyces bruxellensis]QOU21579.1 hypothetical protein BRETT_001304 [Brettanomyces bruxellensis]
MTLSFAASNAITYVTYGVMLITGVAIALYHAKFKTTKDFLCSNGTRKALPLALNFIASGENPYEMMN